ncbi:translation elongation factor 4 [bacterium]|nr:translation elongation factor 4 [bacterium]
MTNSSKIRNFCIIAHIDHGKSTLADRFLQITKTVPEKKFKPQFLDRLEAEREHGITIKMQPVQMKFKGVVLNLIDTPGHIDFAYEVSRALKAVEGAILLVDAVSGVQAQTLSVLEMAKKEGLRIIPAVNKIDLSQADPKKTAEEIKEVLSPQTEISFVSAKTGEGVSSLLERVIKETPSPQSLPQKELKSLVFDAHYDTHSGVVAHVRIFSGQISQGEKIYLVGTKTEAKAEKVGIFKPHLTSERVLKAGEIGFVLTNLKDIHKVLVGDTLTHSPTLKPNFSVLSGFKKPKPKVFASLYPVDENDYVRLRESLELLSLSDSSFEFRPELSGLLGRGFRLGALGSLHLQIIRERLEKEFSLETLLTAPRVKYKFKFRDGSWQTTDQIEKIDFSLVSEVFEPKAKIKVIVPAEFQGKIMEYLHQQRGTMINTQYLGNSQRLFLEYEVPLVLVVRGLFSKILSLSSGFASLDYSFSGYKKEELVKVDISIADKIFPALSFLAHKNEAYKEAREKVDKIKEVLPRQLFEVHIRAQVGSRVIAKAKLSPLRKDVLAKLYGGDRTRKDKLLKKQKEGKKKLKQIGNLHLPPEFFQKLSK